MLALVPAHSDHPGELGPITVHSALTTWALEPVPAAIVLVVGALYVTGVVRLRRRGDRWSPGRTLSFLVGLATIVVATQSFLAVYDLELLSVHMVQHMVLSMVSPVFLALGAPITLALRTLPKGGRALLMRVVHSRFVTVLTFPLVAMALFVVNPWVLYFTPFYEATLRNPLLHDLNHLHLLLVGCLWFWVLLGIDPLPNRPLYPMRVVAVLLTLPFHAFLGVTIMGSTQLIAANWYLSLDRDWGPSPLDDQQIAGGILWGTGDLVAGLLFAVLSVQWARASEREARAVDRRLDLQEARAAATARRLSGTAPPPDAAAAAGSGSPAAHTGAAPTAAAAVGTGAASGPPQDGPGTGGPRIGP